MYTLPQIETDFLHRLRQRLKKASEEKPENRSLLVSFEKQFYKAKDEAYFAPCEREDPLGAKNTMLLSASYINIKIEYCS